MDLQRQDVQAHTMHGVNLEGAVEEIESIAAFDAVAASRTDEALALARKQYQNYKILVERTVEVFGDEIKASLWLSTPSADFQNEVPMHVAQSVEYSASELERLFEPVFMRIEHGIYT